MYDHQNGGTAIALHSGQIRDLTPPYNSLVPTHPARLYM